jgi:hypothetical protein
MTQETGLSIFGDNRTVELMPIAGWTFVYNINTDMVTTSVVGSGTVTHANAMAVLSTGAAINSSALLRTNRALRYLPGLGGKMRFTAVFSTPKEGSRQIIGLKTEDNGFYLGFIDTDFVVVRYSNSVESVTISDNFNIPFNPDGVIDFTKGQVYEIDYQWLGFGRIEFKIENQETGMFELLHVLKYPNTATVPSLENPTLHVRAEVENTTNDTDITLKTPSAMAFREGLYFPVVDPLTLTRSFEGIATISTEVPILSIRTVTTYQGKDAHLHIVPAVISLVTDGTKSVIFRLYRNVSLTGASFTPYDLDLSSIESDTSATAISGTPTFVFSYNLGRTASFKDDISSWDISLQPGEIFTITAASAQSSDVSVTLLVDEPF